MKRTTVSALLIYLVVAAVTTWVADLVETRLRRETGFLRTYTALADDASRLPAEVAADVDLAFLDAALDLPRRFFSVRWEGFLYVVSPLVVDFWAGADDEVTLTLDGRRLLERNPVAGMHSVLRTARLTPGLHTLGIEYAQAGGGSYLNAQWAPSGRRPESLGSLFVFPNRPDDTQIATATRLSAIRNVAALLWIGVPFVVALLVGLPAAVRFASRRLATGGPPATPVIKTRGVPWLRWVDRHPGACLTVVLAAGLVLRGLLVAGSPAAFGYVYDPYFEPVELLYRNGALPQSADCWQCYHPPLFYVVGLPFFTAGMWLSGHDASEAVRVLGYLAPVCAVFCVIYCYRLFRLFRLRGLELCLAMTVVVSLPLFFLSSYGAEADILLTAFMVAFLYYLTEWHVRRRSPTLRQVVTLGGLAGLAMATKYSGLIAILVAGELVALHLIDGRHRRRTVRDGLVILAICLAIGSWKYVDNATKFRTVFFANGSAQEGFRAAPAKRYWDRYDFVSFELPALLALTRPDAPDGPLSYLPVYESVWTTLYGMTWSDMSFFSNPTRGGMDLAYVWRGVPPWLTSSVLVLGLLPSLLAVAGIAATVRRRAFMPIVLMCATVLAVYVYWFTAQEAWALKTKYLLFLLPAFGLYLAMGLRWLRRWTPPAVSGAAVWLIVVLIVLCHGYAYRFAVGEPFR